MHYQNVEEDVLLPTSLHTHVLSSKDIPLTYGVGGREVQSVFYKGRCIMMTV